MYKSMKNKKIVFLTGTRADFGKMSPLINQAADLGNQVSVFVTGMHMLNKFGLTKEEVRNLESVDIYEFINQRSTDSHAQILSKTISGFADFIEEIKPDLVFVHGDRVEALAGSLACTTEGVLVAHVEGGELSGTIDETYRHAITKLSDFHFVSSVSAARRVTQLGEQPEGIYVIGSPELDLHSREPVPIQTVKERYGIEFDEFGIFIFHPVFYERHVTSKYVKGILDGMKKSNKNFVFILPNNDPGSDQIIEEIEKYEDEPWLKIIPSMRFNYFSSLLRHSSLILGNSSLGVREAPFLGVASVNIGTRQKNRNNSASITHLDYEQIGDLQGIINSCWAEKYQVATDFGDGNAALAFKKILSSEEFWSRNKEKQFASI